MSADSNEPIFSPVDDFMSFAGFSCGDDDLDDFIQRDAVIIPFLPQFNLDPMPPF